MTTPTPGNNTPPAIVPSAVIPPRPSGLPSTTATAAPATTVRGTVTTPTPAQTPAAKAPTPRRARRINLRGHRTPKPCACCGETLCSCQCPVRGPHHQHSGTCCSCCPSNPSNGTGTATPPQAAPSQTPPEQKTGEDPEPAAEDDDQPAKAGRVDQIVNKVFTGGWHTARVRWVIRHAAPAAPGWYLGLGPTITGWLYDCAADYSTASAMVLSGLAVTAGGLTAWRTRSWWPPLAWCCRVPLATAVTAAAAFAPAALYL